MIKGLFVLLMLLTGMRIDAQAQTQTLLKDYTLSSRLNPECVSQVSLTLFDEKYGLHKLNQLIIDGLTDHHYLFQKQLMDQSNFYANRTFGEDTVLDFTIMASCSYQSNGIYVFVGCPYNACDKRPKSDMEACMVVIDSLEGKSLKLRDIIHPGKIDSLANFALMVLNRYRIKNTPSCNYASLSPVDVRTSNSVISPNNVITYHMGLEERFLLTNDKIILYNFAEHTAYIYQSVELALPLNLIKYFLKESYANRLFPKM